MQRGSIESDRQEAQISIAATRSCLDASRIIAVFGESDDTSPADDSKRTPHIPYQRNDGLGVLLQLVGTNQSDKPVKQFLFEHIKCYEISLPTDAGGSQKRFLFQLNLNNDVWRDGTEVKTTEQINFINAIIHHIEEGCIGKKSQHA